MAKLNKEQLKKLYDYGGTLSPKNWADMIDSVVPDIEIPNDVIKTTYTELVDKINNGKLIPNQWYEFDYYNRKLKTYTQYENGSIEKVRVKAKNNYYLYEEALCYGIPFIGDIDGDPETIYSKWVNCKYTIESIHYEEQFELFFTKINSDQLKIEKPAHIQSLIWNTMLNNEFIFISSNEDCIIYESSRGDISSIDVTNKGIYILNECINFYKQTGFVYDIRFGKSFFSYDIFGDTFANYNGYLIAPDDNIISYFIGDPLLHTILGGEIPSIYESHIINSCISLSRGLQSVLDIKAINYTGIVGSTGSYICSTNDFNEGSIDVIFVDGNIINSYLRFDDYNGGMLYGFSHKMTFKDIIDPIIIDRNSFYYEDEESMEVLPRHDYEHGFITQSKYSGLHFEEYKESNI